MINNLLNFLMNTFALLKHEKMSSAQWTMMSKNSLESKQTTQMDREVATSCYESQMLDFDFLFRNFTRNIPPHEASLDSNRTSNIDSSFL